MRLSVGLQGSLSTNLCFLSSERKLFRRNFWMSLLYCKGNATFQAKFPYSHCFTRATGMKGEEAVGITEALQNAAWQKLHQVPTCSII